jgi:hypothetical protein
MNPENDGSFTDEIGKALSPAEAVTILMKLISIQIAVLNRQMERLNKKWDEAICFITQKFGEQK